VIPDLTGRVVDLLAARTPFCLATVVSTSGQAPVETGQKLIVRADGGVEGSLGGGALEQAVRAAALAQLERDEIGLARLGLDGTALPRRRPEHGGSAPGGYVEVALEPMLPPPRLIIVGAGHIAVPLARFAKLTGFEVCVIDDRGRFASRERFPDADEVVVDDFERAIAAQTMTPWTYLVLVTRGHEHDEATLRRVVESPAPYIGMIGSRRRVLLVFQRLVREGVPEAFLDRVYAPIGLDIGARTPAETAMAICAEVLAALVR
jgi:xanthine dehydrogenase accessory factor